MRRQRVEGRPKPPAGEEHPRLLRFLGAHLLLRLLNILVERNLFLEGERGLLVASRDAGFVVVERSFVAMAAHFSMRLRLSLPRSGCPRACYQLERPCARLHASPNSCKRLPSVPMSSAWVTSPRWNQRRSKNHL